MQPVIGGNPYFDPVRAADPGSITQFVIYKTGFGQYDAVRNKIQLTPQSIPTHKTHEKDTSGINGLIIYLFFGPCICCRTGRI